MYVFKVSQIMYYTFRHSLFFDLKRCFSIFVAYNLIEKHHVNAAKANIHALIAVMDREDHLATTKEWGDEEQVGIKHNIMLG